MSCFYVSDQYSQKYKTAGRLQSLLYFNLRVLRQQTGGLTDFVPFGNQYPHTEFVLGCFVR